MRLPAFDPAEVPVAPAAEVDDAVALLRETGFLALTGAGISTDSGIPDYRGPGSVDRSPMTYQEFVSGPEAQRRYWARSYVGWGRMHRAEPNTGHHALARLERRGLCRGVVTQNVDGLHERAGTNLVVALHGRIADVVCLACGHVSGRWGLQQRMDELNAGWSAGRDAAPVRPDGDVELDDTTGFRVPGCDRCGGVLKPHVVFFGETVPKHRVLTCYDLVEAAPALLVLGSSLTVLSGLRFVRAAARSGTPVVVVNRGTTRGDPLATYKVDHGTSEFLTHPAWD